MNQEKARAIFIEYLTKPDFDRVYFLIEKEEESNRPPEVFARYMLEAFQYYNDALYNGFQQFKSWGNDPQDYSMALFQESGGQITGHLYLSQMSYHYEGINEYINKRCSKKKEPEKLAHARGEKTTEALYNFYMGTYPKKPKKGEPYFMYKKTLEWAKDDYRLHANGDRNSLNTKSKHMETVLKRVLFEKKPGWESRQKRINQDIKTLFENFNKKVPD